MKWYEVFYGSKETMQKIADRGAVGLNPKTHRWQKISKTANYKVKRAGGVLYDLLADEDLAKTAKKKGLIL